MGKNKNVLNIVFVIISLLISPMVSAKDKVLPFIRDGISFSIAEGWKTIANDSIGENAYYFSAEREAVKSTGLITITWINKIEDPGKMIDIHQKSMKSANMYRNPGIEFSLVENAIFAGLKVRRCNYVTFVKEQKLEGTIYSFNTSAKTITIFFQSGIEDKKLNQTAFELIQQTFNCRD